MRTSSKRRVAVCSTWDRLETSSLDGQWIAFVSDRNGSWAIWVVPIAGGEPSHLFDLPSDVPWGTGERAWITERISWGGVAGDYPLPWNPPSAPDYGDSLPRGTWSGTRDALIGIIRLKPDIGEAAATGITTT